MHGAKKLLVAPKLEYGRFVAKTYKSIGQMAKAFAIIRTLMHMSSS